MRIKPLLIFLFVGIFSIHCKQNAAGTGQGSSIEGIETTYTGHWLSDCVDFGHGLYHRIYTEIETDLTINIAYVTYESENCSGAHVLTDSMGNSVTEATYAQDYQEMVVTDIPEGFYSLQITDATTLEVQYVFMYTNNQELYQLVGFADPHDTWTQWQGEADVYSFSQDPLNYSPTVYEKFHFTKSELP